MNRNRIYLIGYMGCGKTSIGKQLAKNLDMQFIDLDTFIENRYHKSIDTIFNEQGEAAFREMERKALNEVSEFMNVVISTGGGTPCYCDNMAMMLATGHTIYLKTSANELAQRLIKGNNSRPLIKDRSKDGLTEFIEEGLREREGYYNCADYIYDTEEMISKKDVSSCVDHLIVLLSTEKTN